MNDECVNCSHRAPGGCAMECWNEYNVYWTSGDEEDDY